MDRLVLLLALAATGGCMNVENEVPASQAPAAGRIVRADARIDALLASDAAVEELAAGFVWSEGPVWIRDGGYLLFSDVPANRMYRWHPREGLSVFLDPSGYDGPGTAVFREPGSNGLIPGRPGTILVADHGNRAVAMLDLATRRKTLLATRFEGRRFNSPNDLVRGSDGSIWFTDPPYGLEGLNRSPAKELAWNGVYRLRPDGSVALVVADMTFPNGILLSPDERTLYVANSDPDHAVIMAFGLDAGGAVVSRRILADMTALARSGLPGLPDGMAIDRDGNLFATGPGGVHVLAPDGTPLGRIETGSAVANCAFGGDGRTLFLASHSRLARIETRSTGLGY